MTTRPSDNHANAERIQAFLDGELSGGALVAFEEHVASCARCAGELDGWRGLWEDLDGVAPYRPHEGFADRVMGGVRVPAPLPLAARVRSRLWAIVTPAGSGHPAAEHLQDLVEGLLPARRRATVQAHLATCARCEAEAASWRHVIARLDRLERLAPAGGFAERVMARLPRRVAATATGASARWGRALAHAARMVPRTRRAWAAISGVAVTPAVVAGLLLYVVFSHPTLTPGSLASFLWWQLGDLAAAGWATASAAALDSAPLFRLYSFVQTLAAAPWAVAFGFLAYSAGCVLALRVLYRNLRTAPSEGRYAHATAS